MAYCWEVFEQSKCETCKHYLAFQEGTLDLEKFRDIVVIDDE